MSKIKSILKDIIGGIVVVGIIIGILYISTIGGSDEEHDEPTAKYTTDTLIIKDMVYFVSHRTDTIVRMPKDKFDDKIKRRDEYRREHPKVN